MPTGVYNTRFDKLTTDALEFTDKKLITMLGQIHNYVGGKLWIHRLYSDENDDSQHYRGRAADGHIEGMSLIDQYVLLERFNPGGLGLYGSDVWRNPGFHFDTRDKGVPTAKWGCIQEAGAKRQYVELNKTFFQRIIRLEEGTDA